MAGCCCSHVALARPLEQRPDDAAPLAAELAAGRVALARVVGPRTRRPRRRRRGARASGSRCCRPRPRRSTSPRSAGSRGSRRSRRTRPAADGSSQRSSVSIALKATAPSWSSTLIFGKSGLPSLEHVELDLDADRPAHVDDARRHRPRARAPDRADPREVVPGADPPARCARCLPHASGGGSSRSTSAAGPSPHELSAVDPDRAVAELRDGRQCVGDEDHRPARVGELLHAPEAAPLELGVADGEHLVHEQDLRLQVRGDGEREPDVHAARVALDGRVDELLDSRRTRRCRRSAARSPGASCRGSPRSGRRSRGR